MCWAVSPTGDNDSKLIKQYRLVDAALVTNRPAFDHERLAQALAGVSDEQVDAGNLPISTISMELTHSSSEHVQMVDSIQFSAFGLHWIYNESTGVCKEQQVLPGGWEVSPDGTQAVFVRKDNLWVSDLVTKKERQLTHDGEATYAYGAMSTAWGVVNDICSLQVCWSPDSNTVFTLQRDTRRVKSLPIVHHVPADGSIRPQLEEIKVAYPGDDHTEELRLLAINLETGDIQAADYPQIPSTRNGYGFFTSKLGWWGNNSRHAYFVDMARDYKAVRVVEFDTHTGATRILIEEHSTTQINLMLGGDDHPTLLPLPESQELLWFSERTGWGHIYLYDLNTGDLKNTLTAGDWLVRNIAGVDLKRREVFVQTAGRDKMVDPYYRDLVRINMDNAELTPLVVSNHDNVTIVPTEFSVGIARLSKDVKASSGIQPNGDFAVVTRSRADQIPVSFLVDRNGEQIMTLEVTDTSALPLNWQWPEPVKLLAADGQTDIYGLVFRPSYFSADQVYPVISLGFNNPEIPWVGKGAFTNDIAGGWPTMDAMALAELGFIVVKIDGRGTTLRHKAFHDESYGAFQTASNIDDHVTGIRQLAERYAYMDLNRVGISAHTSGGSGCIEGMLRYPDFFKVGVSSCVHDWRMMSAPMMSEKYEGFPGMEGYLPAEARIEALKGKLLLIHGMLDWCIPPASTFRLVEALQKADKDFDMLLMPNVGHDSNAYILRRTWDYFVTHLLGEAPSN
ncbi:hypothetical protein BST96_06570 [Oceanicoccus sagamiensis]|uniref:Peptidase S9 n=2 Tax=Oceanicoccus sagamiensis TaxID=716816 RepID=A0A1X9N9P7_9GAMM|nr:hypothetical protein BST96_06570 [Oceanicoccus sagamiensis]